MVGSSVSRWQKSNNDDDSVTLNLCCHDTSTTIASKTAGQKRVHKTACSTLDVSSTRSSEDEDDGSTTTTDDNHEDDDYTTTDSESTAPKRDRKPTRRVQPDPPEQLQQPSLPDAPSIRADPTGEAFTDNEDTKERVTEQDGEQPSCSDDDDDEAVEVELAYEQESVSLESSIVNSSCCSEEKSTTKTRVRLPDAPTDDAELRFAQHSDEQRAIVVQEISADKSAELETKELILEQELDATSLEKEPTISQSSITGCKEIVPREDIQPDDIPTAVMPDSNVCELAPKNGPQIKESQELLLSSTTAREEGEEVTYKESPSCEKDSNLDDMTQHDHDSSAIEASAAVPTFDDGVSYNLTCSFTDTRASRVETMSSCESSSEEVSLDARGTSEDSYSSSTSSSSYTTLSDDWRQVASKKAELLLNSILGGKEEESHEDSSDQNEEDAQKLDLDPAAPTVCDGEANGAMAECVLYAPIEGQECMKFDENSPGILANPKLKSNIGNHAFDQDNLVPIASAVADDPMSSERDTEITQVLSVLSNGTYVEKNGAALFSENPNALLSSNACQANQVTVLSRESIVDKVGEVVPVSLLSNGARMYLCESFLPVDSTDACFDKNGEEIEISLSLLMRSNEAWAAMSNGSIEDKNDFISSSESMVTTTSNGSIVKQSETIFSIKSSASYVDKDGLIFSATPAAASYETDMSTRLYVDEYGVIFSELPVTLHAKPTPSIHSEHIQTLECSTDVDQGTKATAPSRFTFYQRDLIQDTANTVSLVEVTLEGGQNSEFVKIDGNGKDSANRAQELINTDDEIMMARSEDLKNSGTSDETATTENALKAASLSPVSGKTESLLEQPGPEESGEHNLPVRSWATFWQDYESTARSKPTGSPGGGTRFANSASHINDSPEGPASPTIESAAKERASLSVAEKIRSISNEKAGTYCSPTERRNKFLNMIMSSDSEHSDPDLDCIAVGASFQDVAKETIEVDGETIEVLELTK
jgi:hypothetical protein